jgi:hypothetical protein
MKTLIVSSDKKVDFSPITKLAIQTDYQVDSVKFLVPKVYEEALPLTGWGVGFQLPDASGDIDERVTVEEVGDNLELTFALQEGIVSMSGRVTVWLQCISDGHPVYQTFPGDIYITRKPALSNLPNTQDFLDRAIQEVSDIKEEVEQFASDAHEAQQGSEEARDSILINADFVAVAEALPAINAVAQDLDNINAVAGNKANIDLVVENKTNIDIVATDKENIDLVAGTKTNIDAVAGNKVNIDLVAGAKTNIDLLAPKTSDMAILAPKVTEIGQLAPVATEIAEVAGIKDEILAVPQNVTDAQTARDKAHQWAENAEDEPVETGKYSSLHWASKAQQSAESIKQATINAVTDNYTLALTDANKLVILTAATAKVLTVPLNASVAFPIGTGIGVMRGGTGKLTVVVAVGVTVNSATGLELVDQYSGATLIKTGTDAWILTGDTTEETV